MALGKTNKDWAKQLGRFNNQCRTELFIICKLGRRYLLRIKNFITFSKTE